LNEVYADAQLQRIYDGMGSSDVIGWRMDATQ